MQQAIQLDMFYTDKEDFLYQEQQRLENSFRKQLKCCFAMIVEIQDQLMTINQKLSKEEK